MALTPLSAVRAGDTFARHPCLGPKGIVVGHVLLGSPTTYCEGLPMAHMGCPVTPIGFILTGSPLTYIDDLPAARALDIFTCKIVQITASIFTYIS